MATLDWLVVVVFLVGVTGIGLYFARRASKSTEEFFVAGRTIPWWLAGTSMLATSFASDTPLHTTRVIRESGLPATAFYWNGVIQGLIIAYVFAKLWRRTGVVTDNEFIELRYTGNRAAVLRGGWALFKSLFLEILTMAWITLGMTKIVKTILDLPEFVSIPVFGNVRAEVLIVAGLLVITVAFSMASGFWGVISTDIAEFGVAMLGAIVLAVVAMQKVGGPTGLREGLRAQGIEGHMDFLPSFNGDNALIFAFAVYMGVQWWANGQIDGSGQRAQRLLACKDEKNAIAAGVWNMAVQYLIRTWPWYVTALASLILYPGLKDHETAYPQMVRDLLPIGLKGLMVASFFSAFMGTMEAHFNLAASYGLNDVYKRFVAKNRPDRHYVNASRLLTLGVALLAGVGALLLPSVLGAFKFKMELVAGVGAVVVLRWLWWRVTALSEIIALLTSVATAVTLNQLGSFGGETGFPYRLLTIVGVSTLVSVIGTVLTSPEPEEHLIRFYRKVRPPRILWGPIAAKAGPVEASDLGWQTFAQIGLSMVFIYAGMFGLGKLILGEPGLGLSLLSAAVLIGALTLRWVFKAKPIEPGVGVTPAAAP